MLPDFKVNIILSGFKEVSNFLSLKFIGKFGIIKPLFVYYMSALQITVAARSKERSVVGLVVVVAVVVVVVVMVAAAVVVLGVMVAMVTVMVVVVVVVVVLTAAPAAKWESETSGSKKNT
jgi:hypothetical protein